MSNLRDFKTLDGMPRTPEEALAALEEASTLNEAGDLPRLLNLCYRALKPPKPPRNEAAELSDLPWLGLATAAGQCSGTFANRAFIWCRDGIAYATDGHRVHVVKHTHVGTDIALDAYGHSVARPSGLVGPMDKSTQKRFGLGDLDSIRSSRQICVDDLPKRERGEDKDPACGIVTELGDTAWVNEEFLLDFTAGRADRLVSVLPSGDALSAIYLRDGERVAVIMPLKLD